MISSSTIAELILIKNHISDIVSNNRTLSLAQRNDLHTLHKAVEKKIFQLLLNRDYLNHIQSLTHDSPSDTIPSVQVITAPVVPDLTTREKEPTLLEQDPSTYSPDSQEKELPYSEPDLAQKFRLSEAARDILGVDCALDQIDSLMAVSEVKPQSKRQGKKSSG
jgi:hypothetical protein